MAKPRKVIAEMVLDFGKVQLNVVNGQVNPQDQSPEGQDLLKKIGSVINGGDSIKVNLDSGMDVGAPAGPGMPPAPGGDIDGIADSMGDDGMDGMDAGVPDEMGGATPPPPMGGDMGGDMGGMGDEGVDMNPETPIGDEGDEGGGPPPGIGGDEGDKDDSSDESSDEGDSEPAESESDDEGESGDDEGEEKSKKGPPPAFKKKGDKAEESISRIANMISEDIRVCNGRKIL